MAATAFASLPPPPCFAVVFSSQRNQHDQAAHKDWYRHFEVRVARVERAYRGGEGAA